MNILIADDFFATWELVKVETEEAAIDYIKSNGENTENVTVLLSDSNNDDFVEAHKEADKVLFITDYVEE